MYNMLRSIRSLLASFFQLALTVFCYSFTFDVVENQVLNPSSVCSSTNYAVDTDESETMKVSTTFST